MEDYWGNIRDLHYQGVHADLVLKDGGHHRDEEVSKKPSCHVNLRH